MPNADGDERSADEWRWAPSTSPADVVSTFVSNPALRDLVEWFGGSWPARGTLLDRVIALEEFSVRWDRRRGDSRLAVNDDASLAGHMGDAVLAATATLGLGEPSSPDEISADYLVVLGGLVAGCESRVSYAAELLSRPSSTVGELVLLGSFRQLFEEELVDVARYNAAAATELDALTAVVDHHFPIRAGDGWTAKQRGDVDIDPRRSSLWAQRDRPLSISAAAAASTDPSVRPANTADTLSFFARERNLKGASVSLVTNAPYLAFQFFDAIRVLGLPYASEIELLGVPASHSARRFGPAQTLQEVRSALRSARALLESIQSSAN